MTGTAQISISLATYKAIEAQRLSLVEDHDAIIRRALASRSERSSRTLRDHARSCAPVQRKRGNVEVDLFGRAQPVANLKAGYVAILNALVRHKPSLFEHLAHEGTARRRWAATSAEGLYADSPHLARDHALQIAPQWHIDTNLSRVQIDQRLTAAARIAGYRYGEDVKIIGG
jgi:hypothetical protein